MWRNLLVIFMLTLVLSFASVILLFFLPELAPLSVNIYYTPGFPYILSAFLAISITALSAGLAKYLGPVVPITNQGKNIFYQLFFHLVTPGALPSFVWIIIGLISLVFSFLFLMGQIPRCLPSSDLSVSLEISKGNVVIGTLFPQGTTSIEPGTAVKLKAVIELPTNQMSPFMTCSWSALGDGRPKNTKSCSITYNAGVDKTMDVLSLTLQQAHCSPLGDYHFYFKTSQ